MISITVTARAYSRKELKEEFNNYSTRNADLDEFLAAMIKTNQLDKRGDLFYPTYVKTTDEQLVDPQYRVYDASRYGGVQITKQGRYQRIAIAGSIMDERPDPTDMSLVSYQDKQGNWQSITEKTKLVGDSRKPAKPRSSERWRANIPADIVRKYKLKPDTPIRVRVDRIIPRYFGTLSLWGFEIRGMISFISTNEKNKKARNLEVKAERFQFEVNKSIQSEMERAGKRLISITKKWLDKYDPGYYDLYTNCSVEEEGPHTGADYATILTVPPRVGKATIEFKDLDRNKVLAYGEHVLRRNWTEEEDETVIEFFLGDNLSTDAVVHGYKGRDRKYRVKNKKTGTTRTVKHTPYSNMKQATLNFQNKPGFKRKK
jgi:hypothetical protein